MTESRHSVAVTLSPVSGELYLDLALVAYGREVVYCLISKERTIRPHLFIGRYSQKRISWAPSITPQLVVVLRLFSRPVLKVLFLKLVVLVFIGLGQYGL